MASDKYASMYIRLSNEDDVISKSDTKTESNSVRYYATDNYVYGENEIEIVWKFKDRYIDGI